MGGIIGGVIGGIGSLIGGGQASSADKQAAQQSLAGFNYLTGPQGVQGYNATGAAANGALGSILLGGNPAGSAGAPQQTGAAGPTNYGASGQSLLNTINGYEGGNGVGPVIQQQVQQLVSSGASPQQIQQAIQGWAGHTTSAGNQGAVQAIEASARGLSPVQAQAQGAPGATANGPAGTNAPSAYNQYAAGAQNANSMGQQLLGVAPMGQGTQNAFNNYLNSTGYNFMLGQGQQALTGSAAARGLLNSGATAKALTNYGQNLGSQYFNNYLNQLGASQSQSATNAQQYLSNLSGLGNQGLQAGQMIGQAGTTGGANAGSATQSAGMAQSNALNGALSAFSGQIQPAINYFGGL